MRRWDGARRAAARRGSCLAALLAAATALPLGAQPLTERTPNLQGPWITAPRNLHFSFAHRFQVAGQDADVTDIFSDGNLINYPTFDLTYGLFEGAMAGVRYSSNSVVFGGGNEWQPFVKLSPGGGTGSGPVAVSLLAAWNGAAQSVDGELAARFDVDPFFLSVAARGFTDLYDLPADRDDEALALAGGVGLRLNPYLTLAADVADVVAGPDGSAAWSAGLHVGIPFTPHTVSLMATNVTSGTLQGASTGVTGTFFWGFEFTVPFSGFARWGSIVRPGEAEGAAGAEGTPRAPAGVIEVDISRMAFGTERLEVPVGTTVRWVNRDPVAHTSTADGGGWASPLLGPGETFVHTFREPGRHPYHCTPHPFMRAVVVVTDG